MRIRNPWANLDQLWSLTPIPRFPKDEAGCAKDHAEAHPRIRHPGRTGLTAPFASPSTSMPKACWYLDSSEDSPADQRLLVIALRRPCRCPADCRDLASLRNAPTMFVPAWCIETYPRAIELLVENGHEIGHHGWLHATQSADTGDERRVSSAALPRSNAPLASRRPDIAAHRAPSPNSPSTC